MGCSSNAYGVLVLFFFGFLVPEFHILIHDRPNGNHAGHNIDGSGNHHNRRKTGQLQTDGQTDHQRGNTKQRDERGQQAGCPPTLLHPAFFLLTQALPGTQVWGKIKSSDSFLIRSVP